MTNVLEKVAVIRSALSQKISQHGGLKLLPAIAKDMATTIMNSADH